MITEIGVQSYSGYTFTNKYVQQYGWFSQVQYWAKEGCKKDITYHLIYKCEKGDTNVCIQ